MRGSYFPYHLLFLPTVLSYGPFNPSWTTRAPWQSSLGGGSPVPNNSNADECIYSVSIRYIYVYVIGWAKHVSIGSQESTNDVSIYSWLSLPLPPESTALVQQATITYGWKCWAEIGHSCNNPPRRVYRRAGPKSHLVQGPPTGHPHNNSHCNLQGSGPHTIRWRPRSLSKLGGWWISCHANISSI